jgi:hypothetical protein
VGAGRLGNTGRYTWDAVKFLFDTEALDMDWIAAKQVISDKNHFDDSHYDFDAYGIYSRIQNLPIDLDVFYTLKQDTQGVMYPSGTWGDLQAHSAGIYAGGELVNHFDWALLYAHQFGERADKNIDAWGMNAQLGYTFDIAWKPRLGVEYSCASGDNNPQDGHTKRLMACLVESTVLRTNESFAGRIANIRRI